MELKDLQGVHKLFGVDYIPSIRNELKLFDVTELGHDILICLDGVTYLMTEITTRFNTYNLSCPVITNREIKNMTLSQNVNCVYHTEYYTDFITKRTCKTTTLQVYSLEDNRLILEFGVKDTGCSPFIYRYYPKDNNNVDQIDKETNGCDQPSCNKEQRAFAYGDIVRHFKYETLTEEEKLQNKYMYIIRGFAQHTETHEALVIYQALYGNFEVYARPYSMFISEVDHEKYPEIKQKYRLEVVTDSQYKHYHGLVL